MFEYVGRFERVMFEVDINCRHRVRQDHMIRPQDHLIPTTSSNDKHSIQVDARLIDIKKLPAWNEVRGSHFSTKVKSRTNPVCIGDFTARINRACFWKEIRWNRDANCTTKKFVYSISILKETEKRILCYHILDVLHLSKPKRAALLLGSLSSRSHACVAEFSLHDVDSI